MITVVGSINLDLVARVSRLPGPGETVPGSTFASSPGGKGANQALAARRAGAQVRMVGAVGKDAFADEALALLMEAGVELSAVRRSAATTGTALILVGADGENMIAVVPGANASVLPGDLRKADLGHGEHLLLQQEIPLETVEAALVEAERRGAVSILNVAPYREESAAFLARAAIIVANETEFDLYAEALGLAGTDRVARMAAFVEATGRTLIVTLGAAGVEVAAADGRFHVEVEPIEPVDTVGAGDTFCGYLAASLDEGRSLEEAVRRSARAGTLACLKPGAQPSIPKAVEVDG